MYFESVIATFDFNIKSVLDKDQRSKEILLFNSIQQNRNQDSLRLCLSMPILLFLIFNPFKSQTGQFEMNKYELILILQ